MTTVLPLAFAAVVACGLALLGVYPRTKHVGRGVHVEITIGEGEDVADVATRAASMGLLDHPRLFTAYATLSGRSNALVPGVHYVGDALAPNELLARFTRSSNVTRARVTIPEGFTRFDIAKRLESLHVCTSRAFVAATEDRAVLDRAGVRGASLEGYLFPATYELAEDADVVDLALRLKGEYDRRFSAMARIHAEAHEETKKATGLGDAELLVLASLVEKEAVVDDERPIIARVFMNRLTDPAFRPRLLQSDPASGYGCLVRGAKIAACAGYRGKITHDINVDPANDYSTYVHEGLPPTPICNPGVRSIAAVLHPAPSRFLYFVARGEGRHVFSETYDAHREAIRTVAAARGP